MFGRIRSVGYHFLIFFMSWITPSRTSQLGTLDGLIAYALEKNPPTYVRKVHRVNRIMCNGALLDIPLWSETSYLIAWKMNTGPKILFGRMDKETFEVTELPEIGMSTIWNGASYKQEDPRMILLNSSTIFLSATGRFNIRSHFTQMYATGSWNATTGHIVFSDTAWIDFDRHRNTKSHIPFSYNNTLYLMPSINPPIVYFIDHVDSEMNAAVRVIYKGEKLDLPWAEDFGGFLRGGTGAIMVRGVRLTVFHSKSDQDREWAYFVGVITFCPEPPFYMHSMSKVPIIFDKSWYTGIHFSKLASFSIYPLGIAISKDEKFLTLSIGYQWEVTFIVEIEVDGLMKTLSPVNPECIKLPNSTTFPS